MRRTIDRLRAVVMASLALVPFALVLGRLIVEEWTRPAAWLAAVAAAALLIAFLPGAKEGRRSMRSPRVLAAVVGALGVIASLTLVPALYSGEVNLIRRILCAVLYAFFFLLSLREATAREPIFSQMSGLAAGLIAYLVAGVAVWAADWPELRGALLACGAAFLILSAFSLNGESLAGGYAANRTLRPPARMVRANRWMLIALMALVAFVAAFDRIREWVYSAGKAAVRGVILFILWLSSLFPASQTEIGAVEGGPAGFLPMEEAAEPNPFWDILAYVVLAVALIVLAVLLYKLGRKLAKKIRAWLIRVAAYFRRFAENVGEDYVDERVSLFDARELRDSVKENLQRRLRRFTNREKRWERMDAREKARYLLRALYRRAGDSVRNLPALTAREAVRQLSTGSADPDALADLYDRARYSDAPIDENETEALKRAIKL